MRCSLPLRIWCTPAVSGRCCQNVIHRQGRYTPFGRSYHGYCPRFGGRVYTIERYAVMLSVRIFGQSGQRILWCWFRNYERYLSSARAMTYLAAILFMLRYCWPALILCFTYLFDGAKVTFAPATRWRFSSSLSITMEPHRSLKRWKKSLNVWPPWRLHLLSNRL